MRWRENAKKLLGKRMLLRDRKTGLITEVTVVKVSPSGRYVKLAPFPTWKSTEELEEEYDFLEILGEEKKERVAE